ncbi:MAG TPA: hypothetical protein VKV26_03995 [Dehalococcoidia bacterium]|nr:hypothetical protein [Dehalococcoidia bacterium]
MAGAPHDPAVRVWPEVAEAAAPAAVKAIFEEIRSVLRVPFVDQLWRVLAGEPDYLQAAWRWLASWLGSMQAERAADDLRRTALIELAVGLPAHKAFRGDLTRNEVGADDRDRISNFNMAAHYVLPKPLLAATLLARRGNGAQPGAGAAVEPLQPLPRGVADGMPRVEPIDPDEAFGEIPGLFAEIRAAHGYAPIADYYRTIARAGDFLRLAWNPLRPIVGDPEYAKQCGHVIDRAVASAGDVGAAIGQAPPAPERIREALAFYATRLLPQMLVEVTIIKGLTDGPDGAAENRFSLSRRSGRARSGVSGN